MRSARPRPTRKKTDLDEDEAMTRRALDLLGSGRNDAYEAAPAALARIRGNGGKTPGVPRRWTGIEYPIPPIAPVCAGSSKAKTCRTSPCAGRSCRTGRWGRGQAGEAGTLRSPPRPQTRTHAVDVAPAEGTAPRGRDDVICFAKSTGAKLTCRSLAPVTRSRSAPLPLNDNAMSERRSYGGRWRTLADGRFSET